jgi:hypothetical protein
MRRGLVRANVLDAVWPTTRDDSTQPTRSNTGRRYSPLQLPQRTRVRVGTIVKIAVQADQSIASYSQVVFKGWTERRGDALDEGSRRTAARRPCATTVRAI